MPIYEYHCPQCRKNFEEWLKSDDDASTHPCPTCGASSPRIISQTTFILKGGGWYVTEYGSHHTESEDASPEVSQNAPKDGAEAEASAADKGAAKDTSGETKSDAKAETKPAAAAPDKNAAKPAPRPAASQAASSTSGAKPAKPAAASA